MYPFLAAHIDSLHVPFIWLYIVMGFIVQVFILIGFIVIGFTMIYIYIWNGMPIDWSGREGAGSWTTKGKIGLDILLFSIINPFLSINGLISVWGREKPPRAHVQMLYIYIHTLLHASIYIYIYSYFAFTYRFRSFHPIEKTENTPAGCASYFLIYIDIYIYIAIPSFPGFASPMSIKTVSASLRKTIRISLRHQHKARWLDRSCEIVLSN